MTASEITGDWNERTLVEPHGVGPVRSVAVPMPKQGLLKLDVTDLVKSQAAAGKASINLALSLDHGTLQIMARESGLGAQLEFCGNDNNVINPFSNSNSSSDRLIKFEVNVAPPQLVGGALWSTNVVGLTQPGDMIVSVNGWGVLDNLLPSASINAQGDLQIGIKNLNLLNILNVAPKDLTICILR
ncbi:MAG: hypothetical protein R3F23_01480 [Verrucomicrobiia bacterium]